MASSIRLWAASQACAADDAGAHIDRGRQIELVLEGIEDREHRGAHQHGVGQAKRVGIGGRAALPSAGPCRSRDSRRCRRRWRAGPRGPRPGSRRPARAGHRAAAGPAARRRPALTAALRLMLALPRPDLEDDVGLEPDHRVAARVAPSCTLSRRNVFSRPSASFRYAQPASRDRQRPGGRRSGRGPLRRPLQSS